MRSFIYASLLCLALLTTSVGAKPDSSHSAKIDDTIREQRLKDAEHSFQKRKYSDAASAFEYALAIDSDNPDNLRVESRLIDSLTRAKQYLKAAQRFVDLNNTYGPESNWAAANKKKRPEAIRKDIESLLAPGIELAREMETERRKSPSKDTRLASLDALYMALTSLSNNAAQRTEFTKKRAVLLAQQGRAIEASDLLFQAAEKVSEEKLRIQLKVTGIEMLRKIGRIEALVTRKLPWLAYSRKDGAVLESVESPLTETELTFLKRAEEFASDHDEDPHTARYLYERAALMYARAQFEGAQEAVTQILKRSPLDPLTYENAVRLKLNLLDQDQNYTELVAFCRSILKSKVWPAEAREPLLASLRVSEYSRINAIERSKGYEEAAPAYLAYLNEFGQADLETAEDALDSAAQCFTRTKNVAEAAKARERFLTLFPHSTRYSSVLEILSEQQTALGEFAKAGDRLHELAVRFPQHKNASSSLWWSALYAAAGGDPALAEKRLLQYEKLYPKVSPAVRKELESMYAATDQTQKYTELLEQRARHSDLASSLFLERRIEALRRGTDSSQSTAWIERRAPWIEKKTKELKGSLKGRELIAEVALLRSRAAENAIYQAGKSKDKLARLPELERRLIPITNMDCGEWRPAAQAKLAAAYEFLLNSLESDAVPAGMSEVEKHYRASTRQQTIIDPLQMKALETAEKCVLDSYGRGLRSVWIAECYRLAGLRDNEKYPAIRTAYLPPLMLATPPTEFRMQSVGALEIPVGNFSGLLLARIPLPGFEVTADASWLFHKYRELATTAGIEPVKVDYATVRKELERSLGKMSRRIPSEDDTDRLSYLHALRIVKPGAALREAVVQLQKLPGSISLFAVLADAQLELDHPYEASAILRIGLRLAATDDERGALYNQLGVAAILTGNDDEAIAYFTKSNAAAAAANLGWIALRYRDASEAQKQFDTATGMEPDNHLYQVGLGISQIQGGMLRAATETLKKAGPDLTEDPIGILIGSYLKADAQGDPEGAQRAISSWVDDKTSDEGQGGPFSQLLRSLQAQKRKGKFLGQ